MWRTHSGLYAIDTYISSILAKCIKSSYCLLIFRTETIYIIYIRWVPKKNALHVKACVTSSHLYSWFSKRYHQRKFLSPAILIKIILHAEVSLEQSCEWAFPFLITVMSFLHLAWIKIYKIINFWDYFFAVLLMGKICQLYCLEYIECIV